MRIIKGVTKEKNIPFVTRDILDPSAEDSTLKHFKKSTGDEGICRSQRQGYVS